MKKILATTIILCFVVSAFGQGTVSFSNPALYRLSTGQTSDVTVVPGTMAWVPTTAGLFNYGLFYGLGQSTALTFLSAQLGVNSTSTAGVIANPSDGRSPLNLVQIPGSSADETDVWLQVKGWDAAFGTDYNAAYAAFLAVYPGPPYPLWGQTVVVNVNALGASTGPGTSIWQDATGTNPKFLNAFTMFGAIPEPSTAALAGVGTALLLFRLRRRR